MKNLTEPLEIGSIHAISESSYEKLISQKEMVPNDDLGIVFFGDYENTPVGSTSIRPFMFSDSIDGLRHAVALLKTSQLALSSKLVELCELYIEGLTLLSKRDSISCYSDILTMLQKDILVDFAYELKNQGFLHSLFLRKIDDITGVDDYDYYINVVLHNLLREWGEFGNSNSETIHLAKLPITKANILVIPNECERTLINVAGFDPLVPSIKLCINMFFRELDEEPIIGLDPDLLGRLGEIGVDLSHHLKDRICA